MILTRSGPIRANLRLAIPEMFRISSGPFEVEPDSNQSDSRRKNQRFSEAHLIQLSWVLVSYRGKFSLIPCRNEFNVSVIDGYKLYVVPYRRTVYSPCHRLWKVGEGWK